MPRDVVHGDALAAICREHGVSRLRMFGSVASEEFDPRHSDVDFLVDFSPNVPDLFEAYFALVEDLTALFDRDVDLVMSSAVRNPYFAASAFNSAIDVIEELLAAAHDEPRSPRGKQK